MYFLMVPLAIKWAVSTGVENNCLQALCMLLTREYFLSFCVERNYLREFVGFDMKSWNPENISELLRLF
jgi:hypothetical protein